MGALESLDWIKRMRLIDADKLISEFALRVYNIRNNTIMYEHPKSVLWALDVSIKEIEHAPTIEAKPKWVPCSERLPEENGSYIVTSMDYVDTFEAVFDAGEWFSIDYCDDIKNVIAWMPLPEPYKGE